MVRNGLFTNSIIYIYIYILYISYENIISNIIYCNSRLSNESVLMHIHADVGIFIVYIILCEQCTMYMHDCVEVYI